MVFAAGKGTRLEPLTAELPKPAVPVAHAPLVAYALAHLDHYGVDDVRLNLHHLGERLPPVLEPYLPAGMRIRYSREDRLLGTGGGLRQAFADAAPLGPVLVMNGDIQFAPDLARARTAHIRADAIATMVLREHPDPARLGAVEVDEQGRVRRLLGRPERPDEGLRAYMFTGVHILSPRAFRDLPDEGCIIRTAYRAWIDRGETVMAVVDPGPFADVGTLEAYLEANVSFAEGRAPARAPLDLPAVLPDARIGRGAVIEASVVGAGAEVAAGVRLSRSVVWPGARVEADAEGCVITPRGIVRVAP